MLKEIAYEAGGNSIKSLEQKLLKTMILYSK